MNKEPRPTPRTDAELIGPMHGDKATNLFVSADFARKLERELESVHVINTMNGEAWQEDTKALRARLAEISSRRDNEQDAFAAWQRNALARQLALESQCQRMRDALTLINSEIGRLFWTSDDGKELRDGDPKDAEAPASFIEAWEFVRLAIEAPLDLELLNRVRDEIQGQIRVDGHNRGCSYDMMSFDHQSDRCNCGQTLSKLLKSLSPAP